MKKNFLIRCLCALLIGIVLELFVFNFASVRLLLEPGTARDQIFALEDMQPVNWERKDGKLFSAEDPQLFFDAGADGKVIKVTADFLIEPQIDSAQLFYTDNNGEFRVIDSENLSGGHCSFLLRNCPGGILQLDLGNSAGAMLTDLTVTVNPSSPDFSVSRVAAVLLIYVIGSLLFRIQRMPDYTQYISKKEGT